MPSNTESVLVVAAVTLLLQVEGAQETGIFRNPFYKNRNKNFYVPNNKSKAPCGPTCSAPQAPPSHNMTNEAAFASLLLAYVATTLVLLFFEQRHDRQRGAAHGPRRSNHHPWLSARRLLRPVEVVG